MSEGAPEGGEKRSAKAGRRSTLAGLESMKNSGKYCGPRRDIPVAWGRFEMRSREGGRGAGNGEEGATLFIGISRC
jgi:hypothetical protein